MDWRRVSQEPRVRSRALVFSPRTPVSLPRPATPRYMRIGWTASDPRTSTSAAQPEISSSTMPRRRVIAFSSYLRAVTRSFFTPSFSRCMRTSCTVPGIFLVRQLFHGICCILRVYCLYNLLRFRDVQGNSEEPFCACHAKSLY